MKKTNKNTTKYAILVGAFGAMVGYILTSVFRMNNTLVIPIFFSIGAYFGATLGAKKDKKENDKLVENGYKVTSVYKELKSDIYEIILKDKNGEEITKLVPEDRIDITRIEVGDYLFLDEDGNIQQPAAPEKKEKKEKKGRR